MFHSIVAGGLAGYLLRVVPASGFSLSKVTSIKGQLEIIQSFLKDEDIRAENEDESNVVKTWVKQVGEGAYQIEDVIDEYILHFVKQPFGKKPMLPFSPEFFSICQKTESKICDSH